MQRFRRNQVEEAIFRTLGAQGERVDELMAEAARRTGGLDDLGDGPFVEPMALFLESLEKEARLNETGRLIARA